MTTWYATNVYKMVKNLKNVRTIGSARSASFQVISRQIVQVLMLKTRKVTTCLTITIKNNSSSESETDNDGSNTDDLLEVNVETEVTPLDT